MYSMIITALYDHTSYGRCQKNYYFFFNLWKILIISRFDAKEGSQIYKVVCCVKNNNDIVISQVYIQMKGAKGKLNKTQLYKKSGPDKDSEFKFSKGSTHTFKVYGSDIGDIKNITLEVSEGV